MPKYDFKCKECGHTFEKQLKTSERSDYIKNTKCPECSEGEIQQILGNPGFTTSQSLGRKKAPEEFRELMRRIKDAHPNSTIKDR